MAPKTLQEAIILFADEDVCREFLVQMRWPNGVACPRCGSLEVTWQEKQKRWQCRSKHASRMFSVKVGTIFEDSAIPLRKWLPAVWLITSAKNGISSYEVGRALGLSQKSAWFVLHRVRLAMQEGGFDSFRGTVEVDETFIGGKARNMHSDEALFLALSGWWHESTDLLSRPQGKLAHQAYRQIIAMEDRALPFILAELNSVGGQWFAALREITGKNPVRPEHMGHTEQMRADWIAWGRANGFNAGGSPSPPETCVADKDEILPLPEGEFQIAMFNNKSVRRVVHNDEWYFSVVDVMEALTGTASPSRYWNELKANLFKESDQLFGGIEKLPMPGADGRNRATDAANTETLFRIRGRAASYRGTDGRGRRSI